MAEEIKKFNVREEKHVASEITLMSWSPTMDLLALANENGEVIVNRLSWQRVWSLSPFDDRSKQIKVSALAWRPDGKILAVAYSNGTYRLCEVEKGAIIYHRSQAQETITSLVWIEQMKSMVEGVTTYPEDNSSTYLPAAQQMNSLYSDSSVPQTQSLEQETHEVFRNLSTKKDPKVLNVLLTGTTNNKVHLYAYGVFHLCSLELSNDDALEDQAVDSALITPDLSNLSVVVRTKRADHGVAVHVQLYDTALLVSRHEEIRLLCSKCIMIMSTGLEINHIIDQMSEAWEEILREMDSKLLKFAKSKRERKDGSVSNDFLELLLFGTTSLELRSFLVQELTDKGLKKLGYSIENSYSNIQKLVVRQLQRATQNMTAHLSDMHGMSQWYDKFGVLGLNRNIVHTALQSASEFAVSAYEVQQVIDTSIKNFKAFFRWLYVAILRLSNEQPPPEYNKMTQHDIKFVADFLKDSFTNLLGEGEEDDRMDSSVDGELPPKSSGFRLEKVGQYLKDGDLSQPPDYQKNPWVQFVDSSTALKGSKILHPHNMQGKSMSQRKEMMFQTFAETEKPIAKTIGDSMKTVSSFKLFHHTDKLPRPPKVMQFIDEKTNMLWTVFTEQESSAEFLYLMRHPVADSSVLEVVRVSVGVIGGLDMEDQSLDTAPCDRHCFLDLAVWNQQTLTLMLQEVRPTDAAATTTPDGVTLLVQLPLSCIPDQSFTRERPHTYRQGCHMETVDVGPMLSRASVSYQPKVVGHSLAVGGVRTTAAMTLTSQRRIRLFLLEDGEEEEDEEEDKTTQEDSTQQEESMADSSHIEANSMSQGDDKENTD